MLLRFPGGYRGARTLRLRKMGCGKEALGQAVGSGLTPDTMVHLMLQSERFRTLIELFATLVMKTRELDGRRERNNGEGQ